MDIILKTPTTDYAEDIWQFREEILSSNDSDMFAGCGTLKDSLSPQEWINSVTECNKISNEGKAPSSTYIAVSESENKVVGIIELRHHINTPVLSLWGGHIGYTVRPSERRKGIATKMLNLVLQKAKEININRLLLVCDANNIGSEKTILKNCGIFEKAIIIDECEMKRYWINLSEV
jgi:predicted acetyltransferase